MITITALNYPALNYSCIYEVISTLSLFIQHSPMGISLPRGSILPSSNNAICRTNNQTAQEIYHRVKYREPALNMSLLELTE
jgi:hypothetical protein